MDAFHFEAELGLGTTVRVAKFLPARAPAVNRGLLMRIGQALATDEPPDPVEEIRRFPHIIVLQTSAAFTGVADRTRALDGGADSYLVEPIEPDELIPTVHALHRIRAAEQEARRINRNLEELVEERTRELARPTGASPTRSPYRPVGH